MASNNDWCQKVKQYLEMLNLAHYWDGEIVNRLSFKREVKQALFEDQRNNYPIDADSSKTRVQMLLIKNLANPPIT